MKHLLCAILAFVTFPLAAATVSGTVRDLATGTLLPSMTVEAYSAAGTVSGRATTSATGSWALTLPSGSYRFLAYDVQGTWATNFYLDAESYDVSAVVTLASAQNATIHFALQRGGFLAGVVRSFTGDVLPGFKVAVYNMSGTTRGWTTTDAAGAYRLVVPPGSYRAAAWDDGLLYLPRFNDGELAFAAAPILNVATSQELRTDFVLPAASSFSGHVADAVTLAPLPGMIVEAWDIFGRFAGRTTTDGSGAYRLALENGCYQAVFYDPAAIYAPSYLTGAASLGASPHLRLAVGESLTGIDARLDRAATARGRISDARNGSPLSGIVVVAWNPDGTERTRASSNGAGEYSLALPSGSYIIGTQDDSLVYLPRFRFDSASFATAAPLALHSGDIAVVDLALSMGGRFGGTIRSASTALPLSGIHVAAYDANGAVVASSISGDDGSYVLLVPSGTYILAAWHRNGSYVSATRESTAVEGETRSVDFALIPARARSRSARH